MPDTGKKEILRLLSREWEMTGPPGIMDISDIVSAVSTAPGDTMASLKELFASGLIDMNRLKTSAFLTPEGYASVENR